ncbi:hypothetical protein CHAB381_0076 [Campylobacter hominis ATCC BAA-381]|uniref:Uncharacterized protein n=1 Tax=Campylobacter hominis (strain ATCC BAA-381 / DSM 21671 / CCUG 45161 / LMG 19568 / NCTC 13146 / CH001A) TaxID=360107 RepID=A7HZK0_CAMHC|nr:hypothetical protein CHAB381_0076 [Campylobacter hominis ATCC BAA-381]
MLRKILLIRAHFSLYCVAAAFNNFGDKNSFKYQVLFHLYKFFLKYFNPFADFLIL